jgi:hypothetical protein
MSLVHTDEALVANLAVQVALPVLQYWLALQAFFTAVPHAPEPLHPDDMTPVQSVAQVLGQGTSESG